MRQIVDQTGLPVHCSRPNWVIWRSRRRGWPSSLELVLGCRPFALEEGRSPFITVAIEVRQVGCQRDQECRLTPAMWLVAVPTLEAQSCLSPVDLKPFELQELVDSFGLHP